MNFHSILVIIVLVFIIVSLYKEYLGPAFTLLIGVITLGVFGVLSPTEILSGFANEQVAVILMLLLLGDIIRKTAIIEIIFDWIFRGAKSYKGFMARMMLLVASFSAFLNNTPLVAVMMPYVNSWSKRNNISPSKLLIPLSYAAILGGCATLIGTSTNLIVNGFVMEQNLFPEIESLSLFDFSYVGVPMMVIGFLYLLFIGDKILPSNEDNSKDVKMSMRKYIVEAQIRPGSHLIGKKLEDTEFFNLKGLDLIEIYRGQDVLRNLPGSYVLHQEDTLFFAGDTEHIADMVMAGTGLTLPAVGMLSKKRKTEVIELVISHNSSLINKTMKNARLRSRFNGALLAIHRNEEKIAGKIGEVRLKAGDVLLLLAGDDIADRSLDTHDFYFLSKVKEIHKLETYKIVLLLGGTATAILLSAIGFVSLFMALIILLIVLLATNIASPKDLPKSVDYNLAIIIVLSISLGIAMVKTGVADFFADNMITVFIGLGNIGLLIAIYIVTSLLAAFVTNAASVAIVFPVALSMAKNMDMNPIPFILVVSFAAAANFMTPIGYQTNLMVYGPGRYSFTDYLKIGMPLTIIYMIVTVLILNQMYFQ